MSKFAIIVATAMAIVTLQPAITMAGEGQPGIYKGKCYMVKKRVYGFVGTSDIAGWHMKWVRICVPSRG